MAIQNMTLQQVKDGMSNLKTSDLVEFYNKYAKTKIKKFRDRETAEAKVNSLVTFMIKKVDTGEKQAKIAKINKRAMVVLSKIKQLELDFNLEDTPAEKRDKVKMSDLMTEFDTVATTLQPIIDGLAKAGHIVAEGEADTQIFTVTDKGMKAKVVDEEIDFKKVKVGGSPGPRSSFKGKVIKKLVVDNPRREGTHGHRSWELIKNGMTYEAYIEAGGRPNDLKWDLDREWVSVK